MKSEAASERTGSVAGDVRATPLTDAYITKYPDGFGMAPFARELERQLNAARIAISESASSLEAAQKQIEHVKGGRDSAHMARKEARKDRTEAVELLQRASVYAHGVRWPQELFDAVHALLTKYENGLKLLEGPK